MKNKKNRLLTKKNARNKTHTEKYIIFAKGKV